MITYVWQITTQNPDVITNSEDVQLDALLMKKNEAERRLELSKELDPEAMGATEDSIFAHEWNLMCETIQLSLSLKALKTCVIEDRQLEDVQTWFEEAHLKIKNSGWLIKMNTLHQIGICLRQRYVLFGTVPADASLDVFESYDQAYTDLRAARSVLKGVESVTARTNIIVRWSFSKHYDIAMGICIEALGVGQLRNNFHRTVHQDIDLIPQAAPSPIRRIPSLFTELIKWAQRKKARSVTEAVGAEVIVPHNVITNASRNGDAALLVEREAELQNKIINEVGDVVELSRELDNTRAEMRTCPSLEQTMDLRDGRALTESQIEAFVAEFGEDVIIVDYVYLPIEYTGMNAEILPMIYKKGRLASAFFVIDEVRGSKIKSWHSKVQTLVEEVFDQGKPLSNDSVDLNNPYPLIKRAVDLSNPGDPIVLCPTDILFRIPFHAIELADGTPWIQRNPIIYSQSLSMLRLCHTAASAMESAVPPSILAVQALSETDSALPEASNMGFTQKIDASLLGGEEFTKQSFLAACAKSSLINFYGHVCFEPRKGLDQYLESEQVTVRDLFELRLLPGTHVNVIGCQSGRADLGINDDQLGISTALFYAGAASMITALWSIDMADGTAFQEAFFDGLLAQSGQQHHQHEQEMLSGDHRDGSSGFLNLARALQTAVLRISIDEAGQRKAPYHWAAFQLQGCWNRFPLLSEKKKRMAKADFPGAMAVDDI